MSSFEAEWAQLKRDAVAMRLASAGPGSGGAMDVKGSQSAWTSAANAVAGLANDVNSALSALDLGQRGLATGGGVETAAAQSEVYQSWKTYVDMVADRCQRLRGGLGRAGSDLFLTDKGVLALFGSPSTQDQDTPAIGGRGR